MLYLYIGAAIVIGLLIFFVALAVKLVAQKVSGSIRERAVELLSTYDELVEKKSQELKRVAGVVSKKREDIGRLDDRLEKAAAEAERTESNITGDPSYILNVAERMGNSSYQDGNAGSMYKAIRTTFRHDPLDVIRGIVPNLGEKGPATRLLEQLSWNTVYELATLDPAEQVRVLSESLDPISHKLMQDYIDSRGTFKAIEFYEYLKERALTEPSEVVLRVPSTAALGWLPAGVKVLIDDDICEGFQVEANNQLYDYCVKKSEIS